MTRPGAEPGDAVLVDRARRGDPAAFDLLLRRHYSATYAVTLAVLGRREDAEDACQEAWVRVLERIEDCRDPDRFVYWVLRIARNCGHNLRDKRRVRSADPLAESTAVSREDPHRDREQGATREELIRSLGERSSMQREVVLLHDLEGWAHREIAEAAGISEGMSRQRLFQARRLLRRKLGAQVLAERTQPAGEATNHEG